MVKKKLTAHNEYLMSEFFYCNSVSLEFEKQYFFYNLQYCVIHKILLLQRHTKASKLIEDNSFFLTSHDKQKILSEKFKTLETSSSNAAVVR